MEITPKKLRNKEYLFKVKFDKEELKRYSAYGHEAKCFLTRTKRINKMTPTALDTDNYYYIYSYSEEYDNGKRAEVIFEYYNRDNENIILEFVIVFPKKKNFSIAEAKMKYNGKEPAEDIFKESFIEETKEHIKDIFERIFDRENQGSMCRECGYIYIKSDAPQCPRLFVPKK